MLHQSYSLREIAAIIHGELIHDNGHYINELLIDSRQLNNPGQSLFFSILTSRNDGHRFIKELFGRGVRSFVVQYLPPDYKSMPDAVFIRVDDSLDALQLIAEYHRRKFSIPVVGITGSNGKTIVKEWLFQLLNPDIIIVRSPKSYNSQIGVPLSVWKIESRHELAIFEAGISMPGEMKGLQPVILPDIGIITNIGQAHNENFESLKQKADEKLILFSESKKLFYCTDYHEIVAAFNDCSWKSNIKTFTWGFDEKNDLQIKGTVISGNHAVISAFYSNRNVVITIPFTDKASIENAIHCWAFMLDMKYSDVVISQRMLQLLSVAMRLELKEGINDCTIINDGYNSDINSLAIALDFLNQQNQHINKTLILSDILQSGQNEIELYATIALMLTAKGINRIVGIGPAINRQSAVFEMEKAFYPSTESYLSQFRNNQFSNETILLKGARTFGFERIVKRLQQKAHETVLEIELNNLVANLNYYRSKLQPGVKIMAMVKAFGYGSGGFEIAKTLQFYHVDYLAVAYADEGIELRKSGITLPIMVMSPEEHSLEAMLANNLEPEIFSFRLLDFLVQTSQNENNLSIPFINVHIKLDTGMHRLGFMENEVPELIEKLISNPRIRVRSVFSHLAGSDRIEHDEFTRDQISKFLKMSREIGKKLPEPFMRHILNSAGISRFAEAGFEMVRLGIGLYGVPNTDEEKDSLQTVLSLKSTITQIKNIPEKESIGYNRSTYTDRPTRIGIVPIGYADGLSRLLSNGKGKLWVNGQESRIIGNVCMDMCMIDLTDIDADEGDTVVIFDARNPIEIIARDSETIPYEILTRISRRVKRIYFQE
jgi:alanine racemase